MLTGAASSRRASRWASLTAAALLLTWAGENWSRDLELLEGAHELVLTDLVLPQGPTGRVSFAPCRNCTSVSLSLSPQTACFVDGEQQEFARFVDTVARLRTSATSAASFVGVFYEIGSSHVTRIEVVTR